MAEECPDFFVSKLYVIPGSQEDHSDDREEHDSAVERDEASILHHFEGVAHEGVHNEYDDEDNLDKFEEMA